MNEWMREWVMVRGRVVCKWKCARVTNTIRVPTDTGRKAGRGAVGDVVYALTNLYIAAMQHVE